MKIRISNDLVNSTELKEILAKPEEKQDSYRIAERQAEMELAGSLIDRPDLED